MLVVFYTRAVKLKIHATVLLDFNKCNLRSVFNCISPNESRKDIGYRALDIEPCRAKVSNYKGKNSVYTHVAYIMTGNSWARVFN